MKRTLFLVSLFIFFSCTTPPNFYTSPSENGQLFFLRPVTEKVSGNVLQTIDFDATILISDNKIVADPVLNFTLISDKNNHKKVEEASFALVDDEKKVFTENTSLLYRDIKKDKVFIRYTSSISKDSFCSLLSSDSAVDILIVLTDGTTYKIKSKKLNDKFDDLRLLLL